MISRQGEQQVPRPSRARTRFVLGAAFVLFSLPPLVFQFLRPVLAGAASEGWPKVPCTILESRWETMQKAAVARIRYEWEFGGQVHQGDRIAFTGVLTDDPSVATSLVARSPDGGLVGRFPMERPATCSVDPDDPREAVLLPGRQSASPALAVVLLFLGTGAALMLIQSTGPR